MGIQAKRIGNLASSQYSNDALVCNSMSTERKLAGLKMGKRMNGLKIVDKIDFAKMRKKNHSACKG